MKRNLARGSLMAIALFGLLGLGLSIESYRELLATHAGEETWCNFSEVTNCEKAFSSPYSHLFGRPISLYGAAAYFLVAAIAVLGLVNGGPHLLASIFHLSVLSLGLLGATFYFGWALFFQVKTICVLCIGDYTVNLLITATSWWALWKTRPPVRSILRWDFRTAFGSGAATLRTGVMVALFVVLGFLVVHQEKRYYLFKRGFDKILDGTLERRRTPWTRAFPTLGDPKAPIHVVMFGDYQCPYCGMLKRNWSEISEEYPGVVRLTPIASPSNSDCSELAPDNEHHPFACQAAMMSKAVLEKSGVEAYKEIHSRFYERGPFMDQREVIQIGSDHGLTAKELDLALQESKSRKGLEMNIRVSKLAGVNVLPTLLLNGFTITGYTEKWALLRLVEVELERKGLHLEDFAKKG